MTEKQILTKIDAWDKNDNIRAIIDFIENLPIEQRTTAVLSELGRAYNNIYWLDQSEDNEKYLRRAIEVFKYLEEELGETASWNYRIGYSYFYLNEKELAKKHFIKERAMDGCGNDVETYLDCIELAEKKGISCVDVYNGGEAGIEFPLEILLHYIEVYAPKMRQRLAKGVTQTEIDQFESKIGVKLPENFKVFHRTFSGQTDNAPFFGEDQRYIGLNDIEKEQKRWLNLVEKRFGNHWNDLRFSEDSFLDGDIIKNTLFNEKWLPLLAGEDFFICLDLNPLEEDYYGQVISIKIGESIEDSELTFLFHNVIEWIRFTINGLKSGNFNYNEEKNTFSFAENSDEFGPFYYDEDERVALEDYIEKTFGKFDEVFHELVSPDIHCDIYVINPTPERNYYTLVTGGMGAFQMYTPDDYPAPPFAELAINLPPTWNLKSEDEKDYWPIRWLKYLARLPMNHQTYLGYGHTIPTGDVLEGTDFDCLMLVGAVTEHENEEQTQWAVAELPSGKAVGFFYVAPLYPEETNFKLDHSADDLLDKFEAADMPYPPIVNPNRLNVCEGYESIETPNLLDNVAWAFSNRFYGSLMTFWEAIKAYNASIENDIEDFTPFATIFSNSKVMLMYETYIESEKDLLENERLLNPDTFNDPEPDGMFYAQILAELVSEDREYFGALNLLRHIHNTLSNKELGDRIFFEGFDVESFQDDGTPVIYLRLGS